MKGNRHSEVMVIGGGPAGTAAAITLALAGRDVVLLERESAPHHKVCGEFLSREALAYLEALGLDAAALGAMPIQNVRLAGSFGVTGAPLPFAAMSLTRLRLDEALLRLAESAGAKVLRGSRVQSLQPEATGWTTTVQSAYGQPQTFTANTVFLATGKHDLHGRPRAAGSQNDLIAFKMYWRLAPEQAAALAGHVELLLYRGGYAGLQPVEDGAANLCCLVRRGQLQRMSSPGSSGRWNTLLATMQHSCPHLRERLEGAQPLLVRPLAASAIPYGYVRTATDDLWALGDQAAVIPSFTGDGMAIALHSGCLAATMYLGNATAASFQERLGAELTSQVARTTLLSRAMVARPLQGLVSAAVFLWPGVLGSVAERTRIAVCAIL